MWVVLQTTDGRRFSLHYDDPDEGLAAAEKLAIQMPSGEWHTMAWVDEDGKRHDVTCSVESITTEDDDEHIENEGFLI